MGRGDGIRVDSGFQSAHRSASGPRDGAVDHVTDDRAALPPSGRETPRALAVVNPVSGQRTPDLAREAIAAVLEPGAWELEVLETRAEHGQGRLAQRIESSIRQGCRLVIAVGGDGTVGRVAHCIAGLGDSARDVSMAIVPTGTANILARELGIPLDLRAAASLLVAGHQSIALDAMRVGDRHYFTQIGIGLDALIIEHTTREAQIKLGRLAYMLSLARKAMGHRSHRFTFDVDGNSLRMRALQVVVANAGTLGTPPLSWGPDIAPSDGIVNLCVYSANGPTDYLKHAWVVLSGRHRRVAMRRCLPVRRSVRIQSRVPLTAQGDGEIIGETPISVEVVPHAVRILVPSPDLDTEEERESEAAGAPGHGPPALDPPEAHPAAPVAADESRTPSSAEWTLGAIDAAWFLRINGMRRTPALDRFMASISRTMHYGEGWLAVLLLALLIRGRSAAPLIITVGVPLLLTSLTVNYPLKLMFRRKRPFISLVKAVVVGRKPSDSSFPSGHSAAAFAGAMLLTPYFPALAPIFFAIAAVVGFSRIYLGVHYPGDVILGAVAGVTLAAAFQVLVRLLEPALS